MTNKPNLTEEEKEHYSKVAMDMIYMSKTPRTDKAEPKIQFIKGGWVRADFARELEKELNDLKKELDNSKFGSQCIVHELEYDKKTLIKENEKLTNLLNEAIGLADLMSDEINKNWCKESKLAVGKLNLIIEKSGWIRPKNEVDHSEILRDL